jgi:hypothetical protein
MGMTGSGFMKKAAIKYITAVGQKPVNKKRATAINRTQKTEKSK